MKSKGRNPNLVAKGHKLASAHRSTARGARRVACSTLGFALGLPHARGAGGAAGDAGRPRRVRPGRRSLRQEPQKQKRPGDAPTKTWVPSRNFVNTCLNFCCSTQCLNTLLWDLPGDVLAAPASALCGWTGVISLSLSYLVGFFGTCMRLDLLGPGLDRSFDVVSVLVSVALFYIMTNTLLWDLPGDVLAAPASALWLDRCNPLLLESARGCPGSPCIGLVWLDRCNTHSHFSLEAGFVVLLLRLRTLKAPGQGPRSEDRGLQL